MTVRRYATLDVQHAGSTTRIVFDRVEHANSINRQLLQELNDAFSHAESGASCRCVVLEGRGGVFCTGMDFGEAVTASPERVREMTQMYMNTLARMAASRIVVVVKVDGRVLAGGVGFVAASDLALATPRSTFALTEAMWGLLPACVLPYLVRRVGYQPAYAMTLTTDRIDADAALRCHLVDTVSSDLDDALRKLLLRLMRLDPRTVLDLKTYFRHMWFLDEPMREAAVAESARLALEPRVAQNISRFVADGAYPWDPPTPHGVR